MARKLFGLLVLAILFCLNLLHNHIKSSAGVTSIPEKRSAFLPQAVLRRLLRQQYQFLPVTEAILLSVGGWKTSHDGSSRLVGLPGARLQLSTQNSTSIWLDLTIIDQGDNGQSSTCHLKQNPDLPIPLDTEKPTSPLLVSVENSTQLFHLTGSEILHVSRSLRTDVNYDITIEVLETGLMRDSALVLNSVGLSKGGIIKNARTAQGRTEPLLDSWNRQYGKHQNDCDMQHDVVDFIDIIAPSNTLSLNISELSSQNSVKGMTYPDLLQQSELFKIATRTWVVDDCITPKCQIEKQLQKHTLNPFVYFHSNPQTKMQKRPKAYVFSLGLADFHHLFTTSDPLTKSSLEYYTDAFATAYANFILTLRRTRWHTTTLNQDRTHAYNSGPSTTPIFIMVPPLPSSKFYKHNPLLSTALHNALNSMITHLRKDGDPATVLIDTSGWLDDTDFISTTNNTSSPSSDHSVQFNEITTPNASGHRKLSHLLELHLCAYLADDQSLCPFERGHVPYVGNLYVPDEVAVGRTIEEGKIQKIKMRLGRLT